MDPNRDLSYHHESYYLSPLSARSALETRSSSVSSNSSSTSYSTPFSTVSAPPGNMSRALSPASGISEPGSDSLVYARSHYPGPAHDRAHQTQGLPTSLMPSPSQFELSAPLALYPQIQAPRAFSQSSACGGYLVASLPSQSSDLSYQAYAQPYPSFATTAPGYHPSPDLPSYQVPRPTRRQAVMNKPEAAKKPNGLKLLQRLPPCVVAEIRKYLTWYQCCRAAQASRWFRENFHPDNLPDHVKLEGMLYAEQYYGRYGEDEKPESGSAKRCKGKTPPWFACYHCFKLKGFDRFELFKWGNSSPRQTGAIEDGGEGARSAGLTPPANPHYDPTLTRSSLAGAAASDGRSGLGITATANGPADDDGNMDQRIRETWGVRRFCIDCGLRKGYYRALDLIELHKPLKPNEAVWVCRCLKFHWRPHETKCFDCHAIVPLSSPSRRR